jgi:hypothetical protein
MKDMWIQGPNSTENKGEIKEIRSWRSIRDEMKNIQDWGPRWKMH